MLDKKKYIHDSVNAFNNVFKNELQDCDHSMPGRLSPYHVEGDVYTHTMMVSSYFLANFPHDFDTDDSYFLSDNDRGFKILLWACLLHDVGKPSAVVLRETNDVYKKTMTGHELGSANIAHAFLLMHDGFLDDDEIYDCVKLILYHTTAHNIDTDVLQFSDIFTEMLTILNMCDEKGRIHMEKECSI
jgi:hypothetical protein